MSANNHLCRSPLFSSPELSVLSEAELMLWNWLNLRSGETELARAQLGEACCGSLVLFSPPGQENTLGHLCVGRVLCASCHLVQLERMLGRGGRLQQKGWAPGVLQGSWSSRRRYWASELLLEPTEPGMGAAACEIQPQMQCIACWGVKKKKPLSPPPHLGT